MGQKISKVDDPAHLGNPSGKFGMILVQAVYRLADNFELALNRSLFPRIGSEGGTVHSVGENFDIGARLVDVRQQYASVTTHKQLRAIR